MGSQSSVHCIDTLDLVNAKVQQRDFAVPCYRFFPYVAHSDAIQHTRPILDTLLKSISFIAGRSSHLWQKIKILSHPSSSFLQYMQFYRWLVVSKFQLGSNLTYLGGTNIFHPHPRMARFAEGEAPLVLSLLITPMNYGYVSP